jgi:class 3 adenylate cyclase/tetratricopeptide (TPR) repeat protein
MASAVTVTVLFTDLVDTTEGRADRGVDRTEGVRQAHFSSLRQVAGDHQGTVIKNLGNGLMVTFASVRSALAAAVAMQQRTQGDSRRFGVRLALRVGLSIGDVTTEDGDYFGHPVIEAARLCATAEGGQVLATELVRTLAGRTGYEFNDVGDLALKGLARPVSAVAVGWTMQPEAMATMPLPTRLGVVPSLGFVGRSEERSRILQALHVAAAGDGRQIVLLSGEPGIGKTTLAAQVAREAHAEGAVVLYGRCDEELGVPYGPWAEAIAHYVNHSPQSILQAHVERYGGDLIRLAPELAARVPAVPAPRPSDPDTARYLLYGAVADLLESAGAEAPLLLLLDDLHWADGPTLSLLRHLVVSGEMARVAIIGTFRDAEISRTHPLAGLLAELRRQPGVERLMLTGLDEREILGLMETAAGQELGRGAADLARALRRETGGNPFFTSEVLRHLAESGLIYQQADGQWIASRELQAAGLPQSVREVISHRLARLGARGEQVLGWAAVIGPRFDLQVLARVSDVSEDELVDILEQAQAAALIVEAAGSPGSYSFGHALIQHTLYDELSASRRQLAHRRVAETLEGAPEAGPASPVAELARHWMSAARPADVRRTAGYVCRAGDAALAALAPDEAVRWYTDGLALSQKLADVDEELQARLLVGLGDAQRQAGDPAHRDTLLEAARLAGRIGDTACLVRAALANNRGFFSSSGEVDSERVEALEAALAAVGEADSGERAELLALLATELTYRRADDRRRPLSEQAVAMARRIGDPATLLRVLTRRFFALWAPDTLPARQAIAREAVALADQVDDPAAAFWAYAILRNAATEAADRAEEDRGLAREQEVARRLRQPMMRWIAAFVRGKRALRDGDVTAAEALATEALQIGNDTGQPDALLSYGVQLTWIRWHQGRLLELLPLASRMAIDMPAIPGLRATLARACLDAGDEEQARSLLDEAAADGFRFPWDLTWLIGMVSFAEVAGRLGDAGAAELLYGLLEPWHGQIATAGAVDDSVVDHYLGTLASLLGRYDRAEGHFATALEVHRRLPAPFHVARTQLEWARMLLRRAEPGDGRQARQLLDEVLAAAGRHGYALVEQLAHGLLRADYQATP